MWLFFCYTIQLITIKLCTNFRILTQVVAEKSLTENNVDIYYIRVKEGKNENWKKEDKMRISVLISFYTVHFAFLKVYTKFENTGSNRSWEICDRNFHWRERKNEQIKGLISNMWLSFRYTIELITIKLCTKFQNPNSSDCWEIFDRKNVHMYYKREKEGKNENLKKEGKMSISILISIYTVHFAFLKVYTKFENTGSNRSWEICDRNFHWRERKMNK